MTTIEKLIMGGIIGFLLICGFGVNSCTKITKSESESYNDRERKREFEYMEDCLKSQPKHECIYRWQSTIRTSGK